MKKKGVIWTIVIVGIIVLGLAAGTVYFGVLGGAAIETDNIADYDKRLEQNIYGDLRIFPQEIVESASEIEYYYYYRNTIFDPTCQIYLRCTYADADYQAEIERLQNIRERYQKKDAEGGYTTEDFQQEAYIYKCDSTDFYEYALATPETNTILYIHLQFVSEDSVIFDKAYLPKGY